MVHGMNFPFTSNEAPMAGIDLNTADGKAMALRRRYTQTACPTSRPGTLPSGLLLGSGELSIRQAELLAAHSLTPGL